jgi:1-acyl-sn-glycerol-3-phosphate acyltransferase/long-chain acyl-CoA synthetase
MNPPDTHSVSPFIASDDAKAPLKAPPAAVERRAFEAFCRILLRHWCPLTVTGQEYLPKVPFLLCSNHSSHLDSIALMIAAGAGFGDFALLAAQDYFFTGSPMRRLIRRLLTLIEIDRRGGHRNFNDTIVACERFIAGGARGLIVFPEGTRSSSREMGAFKPGAALMALRLGLPLVPAYISGSREAMGRGILVPRPHPISVRFGPTIALASTSAAHGHQRTQARDMAALLHRRIEEMQS